MDQYPNTVTIVEGPGCDWETNAIRTVLEGFGLRVIKYSINRPYDFIAFLTGNDYSVNSAYIVFSFHGDKGKFILPKLHENVYKENEPRHDFDYKDIRKYFKLKDTMIINTGCTLGSQELGSEFITNGCKQYIGATGYVEGNSSLFFVIRLFYEITTNNKTLEEAVHLATSTDHESSLFRLYQ